MNEVFTPAFGLKNRHFQTIYSSLFRNPPTINFEIQRFSLSDGDFLECYWHKVKKQEETTPTVIIFHGLTGSYKSPYVLGLMNELRINGFNSVLMHFRGCSGRDNLLPRSYHSGETGDALEFATSIKKRFSSSNLYGVGYSLGANMLLKLLGELGDNSLFKKVVAVSPPMQLDICADTMNSGFAKLYQKRLIKDLNIALEKKYDRHDMHSLINLQREEVKKLKTFWEFDNAYTASVHGFSSAQDYYEKCSSKQFLKEIKTPTLIIHSKDDPFMTIAVLPKDDELSVNVELELYKYGGHVGFISGNIFKPKYWLEKRIVEYFL